MKPHILGLFLVCTFTFSFFNAKSQSDKYDWSVKIGAGSSWLRTNGNTNSWVGNSSGGLLFFGLGYKNVLVTLKINGTKEMKTKRNLIYDDKILLTGSTISFFYVDINLSYEIDLGSRFFIEPYVGIIRNNPSSNIVHPNGEFLELRSTNGMTFGLNFIKYIRVVKDVFIGPFIGLSYDKMDFKNFSTYLSNNSKRFNLGIVLKAVDKKYQTKGKTIKGFQKLDGAPVY